MNFLVLCGKVTSTQLGYTDRNDPLCYLTLKYKWFEDEKPKYATIDARYYGDKAIEIHEGLMAGGFAIVSGSFERFQSEGQRNYQIYLHGQGMPELIDSYVPLNCMKLAGRLGGSPKMTRFKDGSLKANFSLAIKGVVTSWHNIEAWGANAGTVDRYVDKGSLISVEGALQWFPMRDKETGAYLKDLVPFVKLERLGLLGGKTQRKEDW